MTEKDQKKQNPAPKLKPSIRKLSDKKKLDLILSNQVTTIGNTVALENRLIELREEQKLQSNVIAQIYQHLGIKVSEVSEVIGADEE